MSLASGKKTKKKQKKNYETQGDKRNRSDLQMEMGQQNKGACLWEREKVYEWVSGQKGPLGCEIEMGFGHFVNWHKCNISSIRWFFPSSTIQLTVLPLWITWITSLDLTYLPFLCLSLMSSFCACNCESVYKCNAFFYFFN